MHIQPAQLPIIEVGEKFHRLTASRTSDVGAEEEGRKHRLQKPKQPTEVPMPIPPEVEKEMEEQIDAYIKQLAERLAEYAESLKKPKKDKKE